jgi:phosphohistidine swiveling domain-containing protein
MYWLLEDGKRYGTLPFAGLARVGFIAIQILKSLVNCNILSESDYDAFMGGVSTVSSKLAVDRYDLDKVQFINEYGHLRPGTYDIESIRYDLGSELYFDWNALPSQKIEKKEFSLNLTQMRKIDQLLREHKLDVDPVNLFNFLQSGIELREFAKFEFTKNLSDILELIYKIGSEFGLNRSELSFSNIATFKELHVAALHQNETLRSSIEDGRRQYADTLRTSLPPVISDAIDIWGFEWPQSSPNFITQQTCFGKAVDHHDKFSLEGSIVCIPSADPGYDWLFSYPIAGLITAWGGVNSHMAIRAGELGIPSVIGAGDKLFRQWANAKKLRIDCANKRVEILE